MAKVFLSYRRDDGVASGARSLIYQKLQEHYGLKSVFMDVERMQVARDFRECLQDELENTDVMLVLIGPDWVRLMEERADNVDDFVRIEIETALRLGKAVLPLLLGGAKMPGADQVPESIKSFTFNHGVELDTGRFFNEGMERLCADLNEHVFKGHVSRKKVNKGLVFGGVGLAAAVIVALLAMKFGEDSLKPEIERTADSAEKIAGNTKKVAESTVKISENTGDMAKSLEKMAVSFESLETDGIIENPASANEFYHNARLHELEGDYGNARRAYLGYFKSKEDKLDPHLRFTAMLRLQEGLEGARDTYAMVTKTFPPEVLAPQLAKSLLYNRDQRLPQLEAIAESHPEYAPVYHFLALEFSADRQGARTIASMRKEKEYLERFQELDSEGNLLRYFIDQEEVAAWRSDAQSTLKQLEARMADSVLENPVQLTWMKHNGGWNGNVQVAEPITGLSWKTKEMDDFKETPLTANIDTRTGKPWPTSFFSLPVKQKETEITVKYLDGGGTERGPFTFAMNPNAESWKNDIQALQMTSTSWLAFRDYDGKLNLYFSQVMSFRGAIEKVTYGLNKEIPDTDYPFPVWDEPGTARIPDDFLPLISVPTDTTFVTVQLTYKNGTKSDVVRIDR